MAKKVRKKDELDELADRIVNTELFPDEPQVSDRASTGSTLLDLALSDGFPGGIPMGRVIELYGDFSTSKSTLATTISGAFQRKGGVVHYEDVESTFDPRWADMYGLDFHNNDTFRLYTGVNAYTRLEDFWDKRVAGVIELSKEDNRPHLIINDTQAAMSCATEQDNDLDAKSYHMNRAKILSAAFRKYSPPILSAANVTILILNQTRQKVGAPAFTDQTTTSGGKTTAFYASVRVKLMCGKKIQNSKKVNTGTWIQFEVKKNKSAPPFRKGMLRIMWYYGMDDVFANIDFLAQYQEKNKQGCVTFDGEQKQLKAMMKHVEKNELEEELRQSVYEMWRKIHKPEDRKARVWK